MVGLAELRTSTRNVRQSTRPFEVHDDGGLGGESAGYVRERESARSRTMLRE
jgi:hypothetical protein